MSKIEELYYDWSDDQSNNDDLRTAYAEVSDVLTASLGKQRFIEVEELILQCVVLERLAAFKGGFQQATAIWKECV